MSTITDSFVMQIQIIQHGICTIQLPVIHPDAVEINTPFQIQYTVKNTGPVSDTLWGHLTVGGNQLAGSYWSEVIPVNGTATKTYDHPGISEAVTITLEVGHI